MKSRSHEPAEAVSLDLAQARQNFGCDEELLCEIAKVFIEDVPLLVAELEKACGLNDLPTVCRMAHSLKGLCATFGAEPARTYAHRIECDCGNLAEASLSENSPTREQVRVLVVLLERTIDMLRSELRPGA